jgi:hypothetical protein
MAHKIALAQACDGLVRYKTAVDENFVNKNVVTEIEKPAASPPVIEPYTKEDVALILEACDTTHNWKTRAFRFNDGEAASTDCECRLCDGASEGQSGR